MTDSYREIADNVIEEEMERIKDVEKKTELEQIYNEIKRLSLDQRRTSEIYKQLSTKIIDQHLKQIREENKN